MLFLLNKIYKSNEGFTLVELIVVGVIIGILVAIAVPVYNNITIRAEQATVEANLRIIDGSILRYYALSLSKNKVTKLLCYHCLQGKAVLKQRRQLLKRQVQKVQMFCPKLKIW